jgi:hypothetical protein
MLNNSPGSTAPALTGAFVKAKPDDASASSVKAAMFNGADPMFCTVNVKAANEPTGTSPNDKAAG